MDRLPPEVLSDIFLKTISEDYCRGVQLFNESNLRSLSVSHVCRRWRGVSISYGPLWSYFCMSNKSHPVNVKATFDLFQVRRKDAPLYFDVSFDFNDRDTKPDQKTCKDVVYVILSLVEHQHRWVEARLFWKDETTRRIPPLAPRMTSMPMLNKLYLRTLGAAPIIIDFRQSPKLKTIDVSGDIKVLTQKKDETPELFQLTSSSLVFCTIRSLNDTVRSCLDFLEMAPLLEKVHISFGSHRLSSSQDPTASSANPVVHRKLRCLCLSGTGAVLQHVTLPSLTVLELVRLIQGEIIVNFLKRSAPCLTFLKLDWYREEDTVIEVLRLLPTLQEFHLLIVSVSARFFRELTVSEGGDTSDNHSAALCPSLEMLGVFQRSTDCSVEYRKAFISMVESRARHMGTFPKVTFHYDRKSRQIDIRKLRGTSYCSSYLQGGFLVGHEGRTDSDWYRAGRIFTGTIFFRRDSRPLDP